ncbi:PREDICTED: uncharacterized protein LOC104593691 [Nelumbo nucifera]|nr:PREDICTED: uncharacterized protein LOC104593691 [Nelumbo nucifera]
MAQYNLIDFCLKDRPSRWKKFLKLIKMKDKFDKYWYRRYVDVSPELKEFMFNDLKSKWQSISSASYRHFSTLRGELALEEVHQLPNYDREYVKELDRSIEVEFDETIIRWHIATDVCWKLDSDDNVIKNRPDIEKMITICENVSNYLLYILVSRPFILTAGIGQVRYGDTCAEASNFFHGNEDYDKETIISLDSLTVCKRLVDVETDVAPMDVKGDRSKSVLFDGVKLAKALRKLDDEQRWKTMSLVWMEMLYYAASHCRGNYHAQRLSTGGELLTLVWLLMAHLGIGDQYKVEAGHARAKLSVVADW